MLWNDGDGTFTEGAAKAGITAPGWHSAAAVGDVDGNGRPDLFVTSYADPNVRVESSAGFPSNHLPLRDLLYLNVGTDDEGRSTFREVSKAAGIERKLVGHGLGAVFTDVDRDGRLDLYVANDTDPNQLYRNVPVTERRGQPRLPLRGSGEAAERRRPERRHGRRSGRLQPGRPRRTCSSRTRAGSSTPRTGADEPAGAPYADARPDIAAVIGTRSTAWGDSWADLDLDGDLDLALANGGIPVVDLAKDAQRIQILENVSPRRGATRFALVTGSGLQRVRPVNGRGLATADYDNDGDLDIAVNAIGGRLILLENKTRRAAAGSRFAFAASRPARSSPPLYPTAGGSSARCSPGAATSRPRILASTSDSETRAVVERLTIRFPDGTTTRLRNVAADRVVDVG